MLNKIPCTHFVFSPLIHITSLVDLLKIEHHP